MPLVPDQVPAKSWLWLCSFRVSYLQLVAWKKLSHNSSPNLIRITQVRTTYIYPQWSQTMQPHRVLRCWMNEQRKSVLLMKMRSASCSQSTQSSRAHCTTRGRSFISFRNDSKWRSYWEDKHRGYTRSNRPWRRIKSTWIIWEERRKQRPNGLFSKRQRCLQNDDD